MKKPQIHILFAITLAFAAFVFGFFLGRNYNHASVQVSIPDNTVPTLATETVPVETETQTAATEAISFPININTATKEELMYLPGIGDVIAQRILDYREENGEYSTEADLLNVEDIGTKRLEDILDLITVGG